MTNTTETINTVAPKVEAEVLSGPTPRQVLLTKVLGHKGLMFGAIVLLTIFLMALFAPLLAPYDPYHQDLMHRMIPPVWDAKGSWENILGTDHLGRDYLSRLLYGARISLAIGAIAALISGIIGTSMGGCRGVFWRTCRCLCHLSDQCASCHARGSGGAGGGCAVWRITSGGDHGSWPFALGSVRGRDAICHAAIAIDGICYGSQGHRLFDQAHPV